MLPTHPIDVLDRAFVPGCPGARPGGLTPYELQSAARIAGRDAKVLGIDIVEIDPSKDQNDLSALAGAQVLLAFASGMLRRKR